MISRLYIEDFLLIKDVSLEFGKGLNVISGETGTGKSMTISAIGFVAGKQGNYPEGTAVELEIVSGQEEIILRREIKGGRSRYFLNGRGTTRSVVQDIISENLTIQGQNDSLKLLKEEFQREVIDSYGKLERYVRDVARTYEEFQQTQRVLRDRLKELERLKSQRDYIEFQIKEVEELSLSPEEVDELKNKAEMFKHTEKLARSIANVLNNLYLKEDSALSLIGESLRELLKIRELDASLEEAVDRLFSLKEALEEIEVLLSSKEYQVSQDEIDRVNEKLYRVQRLEDKYKRDFSEVCSYVMSLKDKLESLDAYERGIEEVQAKLEELKRELYSKCERLSRERRRTARLLEENIKEILKELNLEKAELRVNFERTEPTRHGMDKVCFLFSSYGLELKPLDEVASGGELSRLFLALALLQSTSGAYIFDEIDIGISGEASIKLAKLLKRVGERMQVIVITHSSSICAAGDKNFLTRKEFIGDIPLVRVEELSYEEKLKEVARLMGTPTETTIRGAKELIELVS